MNYKFTIGWLLILLLGSCNTSDAPKEVNEQSKQRFNIDQDLLLAHYDCKTDVDDLHSVAALATLLRREGYQGIHYHAVAGAYGAQEGLYVPPNSLFEAAFRDQWWSDAHADQEVALSTVRSIVFKVLSGGGNVWIAEAGQSDFSAALVRSLDGILSIQELKSRIHIVQHSDWNEEAATPEDLDFVKLHTTYHKIPDGNAEDNGTPGFRSEEVVEWQKLVLDSSLQHVWQHAIDLGHQYNGKEGRYLNKAIQKGGLDFSDFSEVWWILELEKMANAQEFFEVMMSDN